MYVILMLVTILAAAALLVILVFNLVRIINTLNGIGGTPTSFLAKLRLGLRAIETETGHLGSAVTQLNVELGAIAGGLTGVDEHLKNTINAVVKQERR